MYRHRQQAAQTKVLILILHQFHTGAIPSLPAILLWIYSRYSDSCQPWAQSLPVKTRREKNSKERGKGSIFHLTPSESWLPCGMWYLFPLLAPFPIMPLTSEVTCHWKMKLWINREDPVVSLISRFCLKSPGGVLNYSSTGALCELHVSVTCPPFACPFVSEGGILGNLIRDHRFRLQKWNKRGNWLY